MGRLNQFALGELDEITVDGRHGKGRPAIIHRLFPKKHS
jgi:hypothetical protein